jgi:DNA-binding transcriptional LysR family regulator
LRIDYLRYFLLVSETGSISQAAEKLYITQQGLSRIISSLEKEFGVALFIRNNNRIKLTEAGEQAVEWAKRLDEDYQSMLQDIRPGQDHSLDMPGRSYVIYATPVTCITIVPQIINVISHRFPDVHFNVIEKLPTEIVDECPLDENSIAVLSISTSLRSLCTQLNQSGRRFEEYFHDILMLSVSKSSPIAKQKMISQRQLAQIPMALHYTELYMVRHLLGESYQPSVLVHTTNHAFCQNIVEHGKAAGFSSALLEYYYPSQKTVMVPLEKSVSLAYGCMYNDALPLSPISEELISIVRGELKRCNDAQRNWDD